MKVNEVAAKQDVLNEKIDNATHGISSILSHLTNASSSTELDVEAKEAVNNLLLTVDSNSEMHTKIDVQDRNATLKISSEQIKLICQQVAELFNDLVTFRTELRTLNEHLTNHIKNNEKAIKIMQQNFDKEIAKVKADFHNEVRSLKMMCYSHDQYSRKNNLIFENFLLPNWALRKDCDGFDLARYVAFWLNNFLPMLKTPVNPYNIDITHPLKSNSQGQPVIIVKFVNRHIKHDIFNHWEILQQHGIAVSEHLSSENLKLKRKAEAIVGPINVWSFDCRLYAFSQGETVNIRNEKSLSFLHPPIDTSYSAVLKRYT